MRVLFVGYGSIAKRHISNLTKLFSGNQEKLSIDLLRRKSTEVPDLINNVYVSITDMTGNYDAVFITNPTSLHYQTLMQCACLAENFFLEKPVFDHPNYDIEHFLRLSKTVYVACPLRYASVINWLKHNYNFDRAYAMRVISSSYLPNWRPGVDYRTTYSAHASQGGGVSIDLIHEWDYVQHLVGPPLRIHSAITKCSDLEINADDIAVYIGEYENMILEMHLDYFGKKHIRQLEIFANDDTIVCDLLNSNIKWLSSGKVLDFQDSRDNYQIRELEHFLGILSGEIKNDNDLKTALRTLKLAKGINE